MNLKIHNKSIRDGQQYMILLRRSKKGIGIYLICIVEHNLWKACDASSIDKVQNIYFQGRMRPRQQLIYLMND